MNTKAPFAARLGAVLLALAMMAGYVVHSQVQHNRSIAPGSKSLVMEPNQKFPTGYAARGTNQAQMSARTERGSNRVHKTSMTLQKTAGPTNQIDPARSMLMSGSKFGKVFDSNSLPKFLAPSTSFTNSIENRFVPNQPATAPVLTNTALSPNSAP